jgi:D-sedoheptulose 7-phosphate isomerase
MSIRVLALDVDGVLTDGKVLLAPDGEEQKRICYRDLDALTRARRSGLVVVLLTGETGRMVQLIARRCGADIVLDGAKEKLSVLSAWLRSEGLTLSGVCYIGDADRDADVLATVGLGLAPSDASELARRSARFTLRTPGGFGVVEEALACIEERARCVPTATAEAATNDLALFIAGSLEEGLAVKRRMVAESVGELAQIALVLRDTLSSGGKVLVFGTGGTTTDGQHVAGELVGGFAMKSSLWPVLALTTDTSIPTPAANDWAFEDVFARQVAALGRPGDLAVGISTSGRSANVLRGLQEAQLRGLRTVAFAGEDPGPMAELADQLFRAPAGRTPCVQELHLAAWHAICGAVERELALGGPVRK